MSDEAGQALWGAMALVLVTSALLARRFALRQGLKMGLAWIAIFALVYGLFLFRDEGRAVLARVGADLGNGGAEVSGSTLHVPIGEDGHFRVNATLNGVGAQFLIDSGATTTAISPALAEAARIEPEGAFPVAVETANGMTTARRGHVEMFAVGPIAQRDAPVLIGGGGAALNLLGMSFLSSLKSWRVEGRTLVLEPRCTLHNTYYRD